MMLLFIELRHPVNEHIFFLRISSMFLYIVCTVLLPHSSMFLHLSFIHFSFTSSYLFLISLSIFHAVFFSIDFYLSPFFHKVKNILFVLFSFRKLELICSSAASVIATLNLTHCWSTSSASPKTSYLF